MSRFRWIVAAGMSVALGSTLAACASTDGAAPDGTPSVSIYIGTDPSFSAVYYAKQAGLFDQEGVNVTLNTFASGTEALESYRSGGAGLVGTGDLPAINAWNKGDTVGVEPLAFDETTFSFLVSGDIQQPSDLIGKTIATKVGSSGSYYAYNYLAEQGLTDQVTIVNLSPADMPAALARGDIAGFIWTVPTILAATQAVPTAHKLVDGSKGYLQNRVMLSASTSLIASSPDIVAKVVKAVSEGCTDMSTDPDAKQKVADYLKVDLSVVEQGSDGVQFSCGFDQAFVDDMTTKGTAGKTAGLVDGPVDWSTMFDTSFLSQVDPALVTGAAK